MQGKIGLEEHFAIEETINDSAGFLGESIWDELQARLVDIHERRLREMDANGMEMMLLSLNAPTIQAIHDVKRANELAIRANDYLAEQVSKRPDRFQGLAALPLQDADLASRELERCIKDLKFKGALVNGFSQAGTPDNLLYYDLLTRIPSTHVVAVTYLLPIWGLFWGYVAHEPILWTAYIGVTIVILGLILLNMTSFDKVKAFFALRPKKATEPDSEPCDAC